MLKRTLSLLLVLTLIVSVFTSCELILGNDPVKLVAAADEANKTTDYTVNTTVIFTTDDEDMKAAVASVGDVSTSFSKSGHSSRSNVSVVLGDLKIEKEYLISSGVLYYTHTETGAGTVNTVKEKVNLNAEERANVYADLAIDAPLSVDDFSNVKLESSKNVHLITCKTMKSESNADMINFVSSSLGLEGATVWITDSQLVIRLVDGKYNGEYLSISYSVILGGVTYDLCMQLSREYDVTTPVSINAPVDVQDYVLKTYTELSK